jgi:hypothetical protein
MLAAPIAHHDETTTFAALVGSGDNQTAPVHRWFSYKEAFSHRLPREILGRLGAGRTRRVADVFGGVATTALALAHDPRVDEVISVEYSPIAHFAGRTKLRWAELEPEALREHAAAISRYRIRKTIEKPELAAFSNPEIFDAQVVRSLLSARERIVKAELAPAERDFLLLGLAGIVEDASGAMKDGRALRILRGRARRRTSLAPLEKSPKDGDVVRWMLRRQWAEMSDDLERLAAQCHLRRAKAGHLRGDARDLSGLALDSGRPAFEPGSIGLHLFSPPYLNCTDYSEIYKLELWLLGFVQTRDEFRQLRLGTLRSHPSVEFPHRGYLRPIRGSAVAEQIERVASFLERNHARAHIGRTARNYFDDMYRVLVEQYRTLEPGGFAVCVVGNSTFSRRDQLNGRREEMWRVPVLTDVLIGALGSEVGFDDVEIWDARDLRPRNVAAGAARESLVVMRKPLG